MIIVSQDKDKIVILDSLAHIFLEGGSRKTIGYGKMTGCSETLGHYETEERAKGVLLEITKAYENAELYKCCSNADIQVAAATLALKEHKNIFIYEMPAE